MPEVARMNSNEEEEQIEPRMSRQNMSLTIRPVAVTVVAAAPGDL